jgi:hypothetical protein
MLLKPESSETQGFWLFCSFNRRHLHPLFWGEGCQPKNLDNERLNKPCFCLLPAKSFNDAFTEGT